MRITSLTVRNFRAITELGLSQLEDTVVIAGPNGCGKSCVFDAVRLLKSAYGGYQPNEWQSWFGEFQINISRRRGDLLGLFQDPKAELLISADVMLADSERRFLVDNARALLTEQIWKEIAPELSGWSLAGGTPVAAHLRVHEDEVNRRVEASLPTLQQQLLAASHRGEVRILPNGEVKVAPSQVLETVFSQYDPKNLGIVDYHGANRNYGREQIGGINLNIESSSDRLRQHALYNHANKYANLKTEMASSYVRHLLARAADGDAQPDLNLNETLKELFGTFFPGKDFLGPIPTSDGRLLFPVRTPNGAEHDIDELSSGEKEVLYGYLRLRNAAPQK